MAGTKGSGGRSFNDRETSGRVRVLALGEIEKVLKNPKHKLYGQVLVRLAGTVLPRLSEVTGEDGGPVQVDITSSLNKIYGQPDEVHSDGEAGRKS